jgi:hypothetical protein
MKKPGKTRLEVYWTRLEVYRVRLGSYRVRLRVCNARGPGCAPIRARPRAPTRTRTHAHAHPRARAPTRTRTHAHAHPRARAPTRTRTHAHAHAHAHAHPRARAPTRTRTLSRVGDCGGLWASLGVVGRRWASLVGVLCGLGGCVVGVGARCARLPGCAVRASLVRVGARCVGFAMRAPSQRCQRCRQGCQHRQPSSV